MRYLMVSKNKHHLSEDGIENPSLAITVCHHSASLVMPNGDPRDGFFYPTLTLMMDSYSIGGVMVNLSHTGNLLMRTWKTVKTR